MSDLAQPLLSRTASEALELVYRVDTLVEPNTDCKLAYPGIFQGLGKLRDLCHIEIEQGATPVALFHRANNMVYRNGGHPKTWKKAT